MNTLGAVVRSPAGFPVPNPYVAIAAAASRQMRQWGDVLGLHPEAPAEPASPGRRRRRPPPRRGQPTIRTWIEAGSMTSRELTAALGISRKRLADFVRAGLPHGAKAGRDLDPQQVRDWVVARGYADRRGSPHGGRSRPALPRGRAGRPRPGWRPAARAGPANTT